MVQIIDDHGWGDTTKGPQRWTPPRVELAVGGQVRDVEGGAFFVDPDGVEVCIRKLRATVEELVTAVQLVRDAKFPSPGEDEVSRNMARQAGIMANRAEQFIVNWQQQIRATVAALEAQLAAYREVEELNAGRA